MPKEKNGFEIPAKKSFPEMEDAIIAFWQENNIFEKSVVNRSDENRYVFVDGPPFVSGNPHYAHLLISIAKDLIPRYWTMRGKKVRRVFGWDCHGLPIEAKVNEKLNIRNRKQVEEFGVDKYIATCREYVEAQISDWRWYINKVGRWVDLDHAYKTMDWKFGESVLWSFKQMYDKGLIYRGKRVSLYSTETSTPVSEFEVAMDPDNYQDVEDLSVYVKFELTQKTFTEALDNPVFFLSWTTTPWTLPSNFALAINPNLTYVLVKTKNDFFILAEDLADSALKDARYKVVKKLEGKDLLGLSYKPLFSYYKNSCKPADYKVYASDDVTNTEGTGILHIAPAFGELDFNLGLQYGLSDIPDIDGEGRMLVGPWQGLYIRKASPLVADELEKTGLLYRKQPYVHRLPFYRGKSPLIYMAQDAYFVNLKKINKRILELNNDVRWVPEVFKNSRFKDVVESAPDWCISRKRYWGTVMPIWRNENGDELVISSVAELRQYTAQISEKEINGEKTYFFGNKLVSFHRDIMDKIVLKKDGKEYHRIPDILDVWLDSGSVPFAEYHYPYENREIFEKGFPADFIIEYTGQIRAWFQVLFRIAVAIFDRAPFKNVVVTGVLAGTDGKKMSKSFGNFSDAKKVLTNLGGDALRLYFMSSPLMLGENASLNEAEIQNKVRGVLNIYWNSLVYFLTYAKEYNFKPQDANTEHAMDAWITARLEQTIATVSKSIENYVIPSAVRAAEEFINDLSTWYIRRSRDRIAGGDKNALTCLYATLLKSSKAFAPIIPFMTENVYQALKAGKHEELLESVHLEDYPQADEKLIEKEIQLLEDMYKVREIASQGHAIRKEKNLAIKQPLSTLWVSENTKLSPNAQKILAEELNVKEVKWGNPLTEISVTIKINGVEYSIGLVTEISEDLRLEGSLRNLIRQIQRARQLAGLNVGDQIRLILEDTEENGKIISAYKKEFSQKVNALEVSFGDKTDIIKV